MLFFLAKIIIFLFGLFLIFCGFLMFLKPEKSREIIAKAGSTYLVNYIELGTRLVVGIAFLINSLYSIYEVEFRVVGYFLIISAIILMLIPIKKHNALSKQFSEKLKPLYLRFLAPISVGFGILVLYAIVNNLNTANF